MLFRFLSFFSSSSKSLCLGSCSCCCWAGGDVVVVVVVAILYTTIDLCIYCSPVDDLCKRGCTMLHIRLDNTHTQID